MFIAIAYTVHIVWLSLVLVVAFARCGFLVRRIAREPSHRAGLGQE